MKKISLLLTLLLSLLFVSCGAKKEESKPLVVATYPGFAPFTYLNEMNGVDNIGFDIEIAKTIAKNYQREITFTNMEFRELLYAVQKGDVDMAIASITITDERKRTVDFSTQYYETSEVAIIFKDSIDEFANIKTKEDLGQQKHIAAEEGTICINTARNITAGRRMTIDTRERVIELLRTDKVDAIIMDGDIARGVIKQNDDLMILDTIKFSTTYYGIATQKGNTRLLASMNRTINELKSSGQHDRLVASHVDAYMSR